MKGSRNSSLRLRPLLVALALGVGAVGFTAAGASTAALAAGNGGGNGGDHGGGNSGDHGNSGGSHGNSGSHADAATTGSGHAVDLALNTRTIDGVVAVVAPSQLKSLNAAHASPTALAHAAPNSTVGRIATYQRERLAALAITDPALRAAAIATAEANLETSFHRTLTASQIDQVNALLDQKSP